MALIDRYDSLLLDLDGTVWEGGRAIAGAVEAITGSGLPAMYITNNASRAPQVVADMLGDIGLNTRAEQVLTSAQAAIGMVREQCPDASTVYVVGSESFKDLAREAGYTLVESADDHPEVVLHGHNPATGWAELTEAALSIRQGAVYLASNMDTTLPIERGLAVGNGSMIAAVVSATGVHPASAGKPEPTMFRQAAAAIKSKRPLTVGDRLNTDIQGGVAAGMDALHVLTGVSGPLALVTAPANQRPTFVAEDMSALFSDPEDLRPGEQGGFRARREGNRVVLSGGADESTPLQALRTALAAAWSMTEPAEGVDTESEYAARAVRGWTA
ncbi:HAD-IIA family hydrolase [Corynebacterium uterequi]|uniref:Putative sugar phosphatase of HAD superfamily n=1 Tax=Corynebacterium uterequi TaxID=1072256 RepID=A0A0G3HCC1_9CORY|nr:HAD-IIA family hydrolase [Corynebacterium uterequi]AKK11031.1 putative sugar phosphatase of HAD superfamily [Corynebacterium uterequi]